MEMCMLRWIMDHIPNDVICEQKGCKMGTTKSQAKFLKVGQDNDGMTQLKLTFHRNHNFD